MESRSDLTQCKELVEYIARSFFTASQTNKLKPLPISRMSEFTKLKGLLEKTATIFAHSVQKVNIHVSKV